MVDNYIERRAAFRSQHLALAKESCARGEMILGGAFSDPPDGALIVFRGPDKSIAESFAKNDPYVLNGLVKCWEVRAWTVVIGNFD